jgi:hypothetical protein
MPERPVDIVILAEEIHAVTGTEDLDPERALLLGPAKVIAQEFPHLHTHLLDVEREQASFVVGQVVAAMAAVERPALQAFRGGQRWLPVSFQMIPTFAEKVLEHKDGHYIVQDWMGAITEISDEFDYTYIRIARDFVTRKWHKFPVELATAASTSRLRETETWHRTIRSCVVLAAATASRCP